MKRKGWEKIVFLQSEAENSINQTAADFMGGGNNEA